MFRSLTSYLAAVGRAAVVHVVSLIFPVISEHADTIGELHLPHGILVSHKRRRKTVGNVFAFYMRRPFILGISNWFITSSSISLFILIFISFFIIGDNVVQEVVDEIVTDLGLRAHGDGQQSRGPALLATETLRRVAKTVNAGVGHPAEVEILGAAAHPVQTPTALTTAADD